jgi:hypothetical protein
MGRGVATLRGSRVEVYTGVSELLEDGFEWNELVMDITEDIKDRYPSFEDVSEWEGNEVRIVLRNGLCEIAVSEYCGVMCVSVRETKPMGVRFVYNLEDSIINTVNMVCGTAMVKHGSFSNGESVYCKA